MSTTKLSYAAAVTMTITALNSQATSTTAAWQSDVVDNTTDKYLDALVQIAFAALSGAPAGTSGVLVYAYSSLDNSTFTGQATGAQGDLTIDDVGSKASPFRFLGFIPYNASGQVIEGPAMSVAAAFGGVLPPYWGLIVVNATGQALAGSGNAIKWVGVTATSI